MTATVLKADSIIPVTDEERAVIAAAGARLVERPCPTQDELIRHGRGADALLTLSEPVTARVIGELGRCRLIARFGVGLDNVDVNAATDAGIYVSNNVDYCVDEVSDHALALLLALARRILPLDRSVREGTWDTLGVAGGTRRLRGSVLGIWGFGRIARALLPKAAALGLEVWATDPYVPEFEMARLGAVPVDADTLVRGSDFLSLHMPLTSATRHLVGGLVLNAMKPGACLINVSRGGLVDTVALAQALENGAIGGAALDVFEEEPPPTDLSLLRLPNVVVSSHAAQYSVESLAQLRREMFEEVALVLTGAPPARAVNAVEVLASARRRSRGAGGDAEGGQVWTSSEPLGGGR